MLVSCVCQLVDRASCCWPRPLQVESLPRQIGPTGMFLVLHLKSQAYTVFLTNQHWPFPRYHLLTGLKATKFDHLVTWKLSHQEAWKGKSSQLSVQVQSRNSGGGSEEGLERSFPLCLHLNRFS